VITEDLAAQKLEEAKEALRRGDRQAAYQLCVEATHLAPRNVDAWILRGRTADALEETLACMSRSLALDPKHKIARWGLYTSMQQMLERDGFLAYVAETDAFYNIRTGTGLPLTVPKERAQAEPFPPRRPAALQRAYRWLGLGFLALPLAGIGTVLFAPLAGLEALRSFSETKSRADRARARVVLAMAFLELAVALGLGAILFLHF
jgi:hypothetical protein